MGMWEKEFLISSIGTWVKGVANFYKWILCYKEFLILSMDTWVNGAANFIKGFFVIRSF